MSDYLKYEVTGFTEFMGPIHKTCTYYVKCDRFVSSALGEYISYNVKKDCVSELYAMIIVELYVEKTPYERYVSSQRFIKPKILGYFSEPIYGLNKDFQKQYRLSRKFKPHLYRKWIEEYKQIVELSKSLGLSDEETSILAINCVTGKVETNECLELPALE